MINKVYDLLLSKLCNNIEYGIIITNQYLRINFVNKSAQFLLNKENILDENINDVLNNYPDIIDEINKIVSSHKDKINIIESNKTQFCLVPIMYENILKRFLIIISSKEGGKKIRISKSEQKKVEKEKLIKEKKGEDDIKEKISSRLKRL